MGYEQEAFRKLMSNIWGKKSRMQEEMSKGAKGEPFIVQELSRKGPQTPTQLAAAMRATTGRIFSQMGERRTREFVDLAVEFTTYMSLCMPGKSRPTPEQVRQAFGSTGGSDGAAS